MKRTLFAGIIASFDAEIGSMYSEEDRDRGYITAEDRFGSVHEFGLVGLSVAIVDSRRNSFLNTAQLAEYAAAMKKAAKAASNGKSAYMIG